jgi:O-antigen ligase
MTSGVYRTVTDSLPVFIAGIFPVFAVVAPKSIVSVLVLTGVAGLYLAVRRGAWRELFPPVLALLIALTLIWMLFKSLTVFDGSLTIALWFRLTGLMLCGFGALWLFRNLPDGNKRRVHNALIAGIVISLAILLLAVVALHFDLPGLPNPDHPDPLVHFSSGQMIVSMLSALALSVLLARRRPVGAIALISVTLVIFLPMSSIIAIVALLLAAIGLVFGGILPRPALNAIAAILAIIVLITPIGVVSVPNNFAESKVLKESLKPFGFAKGLDRSVQHRLQIWKFVVDRAYEKKYTGWGLDASRRLPGGNALTSLGVSRLPLHPHNGILQVWLELGMPGLILLSLLIGYVALVRAKERSVSYAAAVRMGTILPAITVGCLAFGVWQNWWVASLWLTAALASSFTAAEDDEPGGYGETGIA